MSVSPPQPRRIRILRDEVSRKIAAGEVIDRPFSIVRELLDNSIDSGALAIDAYLEAGGLARVRIVDNGAGMDPEDLALCWQPHATSKIETEDDLLRVSSLGFRGEALSSIAVCSRLEVVSCPGGNETAQRLEVRGGRQVSRGACQGRQGTVVDVTELFFNYPARKKFLRSVSAESGLCRSVFIDRAAAHPGIAFRLFIDNEMKLSLPVAEPLDRIALAYGQLLDARMLGTARVEAGTFTVTMVAGRPALRRRDRRLLQCFVNGRRVSEFSLLQAVEYGYAGHIPGGWHPVAFVFVHIDPDLIDFNIHPAKKEVRFRNLPEVHKAVVEAARNLLASEPELPAPAPAPSRALYGPSPLLPAPRAVPQGAPRGVPPGAPRGVPPGVPRAADPVPAPKEDGIRFLGQVFGVFLVFELPGRILLLDQHAAHERIIFERLGERAPALQELLFPLCFDVSEDEEARILGAAEELEGMGIAVRRTGARAFELTALSPDFQTLGEERLVELVRGVGGEQWKYSLRATAACRMAIKEGDRVDPLMAHELCVGALALPVPRCPHGRPIWHEVSEETLLRMVDRPAKGTPLSGS
jgi:DNA mismatch repair protein MutL